MKTSQLLLLLSISLLSFNCNKEDPPPAPTPTVDITAPVLTITGGNFQMQSLPATAGGGTWTYPGATAIDDYDGDVSAGITISGSVDPNTRGTYDLLYTVNDAAGNMSQELLTVSIVNDAEQMTGTYSVSDTSSLVGLTAYTTTCQSSSTVNNSISISNFGNFGFSFAVPMLINSNQTITVPTPVIINPNTIQVASGSWWIQSFDEYMYFDYVFNDGINTVTCSAGYVR